MVRDSRDDTYRVERTITRREHECPHRSSHSCRATADDKPRAYSTRNKQLAGLPRQIEVSCCDSPHHELLGNSRNIQVPAYETNGLAAVTLVVHLGNLAKSLDAGNMSEVCSDFFAFSTFTLTRADAKVCQYATQLSVILVDEFFGGLSSVRT